MLNGRTLARLLLLLPLLFAGRGQAKATQPPPTKPHGPRPVLLINPTVITDCTQQGVQQALSAGGQITFNCGPSAIVIPIASVLTASTGDFVLDGGGKVTLDGQGSTKILDIPYSPNPRTVTLQNISFINGKAPASNDIKIASGGAITSGSPGTRLHIINATFTNNSTTSVNDADNQGGAIFSNNSYETVISNSVFTNNSAGNGGAFGGIATGLLIYSSQFVNNHAVDTTSGGIVRGYGGAIHLDGVRNSFNPDSNHIFYVADSTFSGNTAIRGGGAISSVVSDNFGTKATFLRSTFSNNEVQGIPGTDNSGQGGAIYHIEDDHAGGRSEDNFEVRDSTFTGNKTSFQGGAVWVYILGHGRVVNSIATALSMADIIQHHAATSSNGLTYAEMGRFAVENGDPAGTNNADAALKDGNGKPVANQARNTQLTAAGLVTSLSVSAMALGASYGAMALGLGFLVLGIVITGLGYALHGLITPEVAKRFGLQPVAA